MQALSFKNPYFNYAVQKKANNQASKMIPAVKARIQELFSKRVYDMRMQNRGMGLSYNELSIAFENICKNIGVNPKDYSDVYLKCIN